MNLDYLLIVAVGNRLTLLAPDGSVIGVYYGENDFHSVIFYGKHCLAGDSKGNLVHIRLDGMVRLNKHDLMNCPLHSIGIIDDTIYCGGIYGICRARFHETDLCEIKYEKLEIETYPVCTNLLSGDNLNIIAIFRSGNNKVHHFIIGYEQKKDFKNDTNADSSVNLGEILINTSVTQRKRRRDKIKRNYLYYTDEVINTVVCYDVFKQEKIFSYKMKDEISDILIGQNTTFVLTINGVHLYGD